MSATITYNFSRPRSAGKGRGFKYISGNITLSANSSFAISAIERKFRQCDKIDVDVSSGFRVQYQKSTSKFNGVIKVYGSNSAGARQDQIAATAATAGTFTAFGI